MTETIDATLLYMAWLLQREHDAGKSYREISVEWKISHPALAIFRRHLRGGGRAFETRVANLVAKGDVGELRRRAAEWHVKNPGWRPAGYRPAGAIPLNRDFAWWSEEARKFAKTRPQIAWAISAAEEKPQGDEPREDRRGAYVARAVEAILDLPPAITAALEKRFKR